MGFSVAVIALGFSSEGCLHAGVAAAYIFCQDVPDDVTGIGPCGEDWARLGQRGGRGEEMYCGNISPKRMHESLENMFVLSPESGL